MRPDAIRKRDAVLKTLWDLEDAGRPSTDAAVAQAARRTVVTLEGILAADNTQENPIETGITWKYLGDACWSLRDVDGRDALERAHQAYTAGEACLTGPGAELPLAKLNFNLANTVDLSGVNANVCLELALAQTIVEVERASSTGVRTCTLCRHRQDCARENWSTPTHPGNTVLSC